MNAPIHIVTVIAVLACQDKFLLVKRSETDAIYPGKWQNLGGKVEDEELIEDALQREIREECGLQIFEKPVFLQSYSWHMIPHEPNRLGLIFLFLLRREQAEYRISLSNELSDVGWFTIEEVGELDAVGEKTARAGTYGQIKEAKKYLTALAKD